MDAAITTTFGQLPALLLTAPDGAQATVTLYGAHLISWQGADGRERLFCSTQSSLDGKRAIRGGVPVIFPQFAARGAGMRHGFARVSTWRVARSGIDDGWAFAVFALAPPDLAPGHAAAWPQSRWRAPSVPAPPSPPPRRRPACGGATTALDRHRPRPARGGPRCARS